MLTHRFIVVCRFINALSREWPIFTATMAIVNPKSSHSVCGSLLAIKIIRTFRPLDLSEGVLAKVCVDRLEGKGSKGDYAGLPRQEGYVCTRYNKIG